jgi:hypothetical protein
MPASIRRRLENGALAGLAGVSCNGFAGLMDVRFHLSMRPCLWKGK